MNLTPSFLELMPTTQRLYKMSKLLQKMFSSIEIIPETYLIHFNSFLSILVALNP
jgi:hypothetical protein